MKKPARIMTFFMALISAFTAVCSAGVSASAVDSEETKIAVIGIDEVDDAPDADRIADCSGYELVMDGEVLLTVEQTVVPSLSTGMDRQYYSADFVLPETEKRVYLVGLDAEKVEEIQGRLILSFAEGADFVLEDLSFIDAEKTADKDMDDELCWAAGAANLITYTGWASLTDFESEDDILEAFIDAYDNKAGNTFYGIGWFFNGVNNFAVRNSAASSAAAGTGGYIRDYAFEQIAGYEKMYAAGVDGMASLCRRLETGCGVALSTSMYSQGHYSGGHTLTCWGFVEDEAYDADDPLRYAGLFLSDSDSDQLSGTDRRLSPNMLHAVALSPYSDETKYNSFAFNYGNFLVAIDECDYLLPYSPDLPAETAEEALRDKVGAPDLYIRSMYLGTDTANPSVLLDKIESGADFFYTPIIVNMADVTYQDVMRISIAVTNANGKTVFSRSVKSASTTIDPEKSAAYGTKLVREGGLPSGDYTITFTLNADRGAAEAYYYNNSYSYNFKVRDSYLLGDVNNNGAVDIMDATLIQRMLALFSDNLPENADQRALISDIGEVTIMDATLVQRYLAEYETNRPIGEKFLYE